MKQTLIAIDQFLNCIVYIRDDGFGYADETLSARLFRCYIQGIVSEKYYEFVDKLFFWQDRHCYHSYRAESERRHLPSHYRC